MPERRRVEWATLTQVDWFNNRRFHGEIGWLTPVGFEGTYCRRSKPVAMASSPVVGPL